MRRRNLREVRRCNGGAHTTGRPALSSAASRPVRSLTGRRCRRVTSHVSGRRRSQRVQGSLS